MVGRTTSQIDIGRHLHASSSSSSRRNSSNYNAACLKDARITLPTTSNQQPKGAFHPTGDQMKTKVLQVVSQLLLPLLLLLMLLLAVLLHSSNSSRTFAS